MIYTVSMPDREWLYPRWPTSGDPEEWVPVVRYLRGSPETIRDTAMALRLIDKGKLRAEKREHGWWVQIGALKETLAANPNFRKFRRETDENGQSHLKVNPNFDDSK